MNVVFQSGWNSGANHQSRRSRGEVQRIVEAILDHRKLQGSDVATSDQVTVVKGIHNDRIGAHITVTAGMETYHIYLTRDYDTRGSSFVWEPTAVCTGATALQGDITRIAHTRGKTIYRIS